MRRGAYLAAPRCVAHGGARLKRRPSCSSHRGLIGYYYRKYSKFCGDDVLFSEIIKRKSPCFLRRRKAIHYTQQVFRSLSGVCKATPAPKKNNNGAGKLAHDIFLLYICALSAHPRARHRRRRGAPTVFSPRSYPLWPTNISKVSPNKNTKRGS